MLKTSKELQIEYNITSDQVRKIAKHDPHCRNGKYYDDDLFRVLYSLHFSSDKVLEQTAHDPDQPARPRGRPPASGPAAERVAEARAVKAEAEAKRAELRMRRDAGELVERRAVGDLGARFLSACRQRLEVLPTRLAGRLVDLTPAEIEAALQAEISAALAELAGLDKLGAPLEKPRTG